MVRAGHDDLEAGLRNRREGIVMVDGDDDSPDRRFARPHGHLDDHRQAGNIGQRLAWQARGRHAGGNQHERPV